MKQKQFIFRLFIVASFEIMITFVGVIFLYATTSRELTLKNLCEQSSDIVIVKVISAQSYLVKEKNRIFTKIELEVTDNLRGQFQKYDKFNLTIYGGTVNGITTIVIGASTFIIGEKSILFLSQRKSNGSGKNFIVVGMAQGKFNLFFDPVTKEEKVVREKINIPLQLEKDGIRLPLTETQAMPLPDLINHIKAYFN